MALWKTAECPACHSPGAKQFLWMVKCPDPSCPNFSPDLAGGRQAGPTREARRPGVETRPLVGDFDPGPNRIEIRYRNHSDEEKLFVGDRTTMRARRRHLSLRLVPTGRRCAFRRDRILNLADFEDLPVLAPKQSLTPVERQILGYHAKHGTTSRRLEEVKRKLGT